MSIYSYRVFKEVVSSGSFVKASEILSLTPSAVSHTIKSMEDEFGFPLFIRNRAGAVLTDEGMQILPHIDALLNAEERIIQQVNKINHHETGVVRVGMFASVASSWFIPVLKSFRTKYPGIEIIMSQGNYSDVRKWLEEKKVDIAFTTDILAKDMNFLPLKTEPIICLTSSDFIPQNKFSVTAEDLRENEVIINNECEAYEAQEFLKSNNIHPSTIYDSVMLSSLFGMVRGGLGICIMPELVAESSPSNIKKYSIVGNPTRTVGLTTSESQFISPACELMRNEITSYVKSL